MFPLAAAFTWRPITPELLLLGAILVVPLAGLAWQKTAAGRRDLGRFTALVFASTLALAAVTLVRGTGLGATIEIADKAALYEVTAFSQFLKVVFLGVALLVTLASLEYAARFRNPIEYYTLIMTATLGMMVVASARDLITLFIGIETASLSSYILAGYAKDDRFRVEAATKYFIIGALSSAVFLYGISLIYGVTGSLRFDAMDEALAGSVGTDAVTFVAIVFILVGIGFKISAAPFHMWAPDVYQGAPDTVAGLLSAGSKAMGFAAAFKILLVGLAAARAEWDTLVALLAVASMVVGNVVALRQTSMKRLLAYSSIAQAGYILIAVVVATQYAVVGGLYHLATNGIMKVTAFTAVAALAAYGMGDSLDDYKGLAKRAPLLALVLAVMLLSLAGVPPFGGFVSKFFLFSSAIYAGVGDGPSWLVWLAVAGIVNSLVSLFYYAKVVRYMYSEAPAGGSDRPLPLAPATTAALVIGLVLIVLAGVWPDFVVESATRAAASLLPAAGP